MKTAATKKQAVELIRRAMSLGFIRTVDASMRFSTSVKLEQRLNFANGYSVQASLIYISFRRPSSRKGARWSVAMRTMTDYNHNSDTQLGLWHASYAVTQHANELAQRPDLKKTNWIGNL